MKCKCNKKQDREVGWRTDSYFKNMTTISSEACGWKTIVKCEHCSQFWLVDEYDKLQNLYAFKVDNPEDISEKKFFEIHKSFLLKIHDGKSNEICKMVDCKESAVNDFAFCADCLINKQNIYE